MRKAVFIFFSLLLMVSIAAIPTDTISARPASSSQLSPPSPAQSADEEELIKDILYELDYAKKLIDDEDIRSYIDDIKNRVKELQKLIKAGDEESALKLKYIIAKALEKLINQLPLASTGMTSAAAATSVSNPGYDELVRIRAKIDKLIDMELKRIPEGEIPVIPGIQRIPEPELERPPQMEKLIIYSAKFLCGPAFGGEGVQPGSYSTAVNVHNPHNATVYLYKKAVIANREDEPRGRISKFREVRLGPDEAIEIDCIDIVSFFRIQQSVATLQTSAINPINSAIRFIKGFVVIYATAPLDVVAVYTASTPVGFSLDVEYLSPSTVGVRPIPPPTEEAECPTGCTCLTQIEAKERDYTLCQGKQTQCGYDASGNVKYCFEKPVEEAKCPTGCFCLTQIEAKERDYTLCQGQKIQCGYDASGNAKYCFEKPAEEAVCPTGCSCLTQVEAKERGYTLCQGKQTQCGYDASGNAKYCFEKPTEEVECPQGCFCLTKAQAEERGYTSLCQDKPCGYDADGNVKLCFKEPPKETECPPGCSCLTQVEAKRLGYSLCNRQQTQCGYDASGNAKYCFEKPAEDIRPGRITIDPAQDRNPVGTKHTITVTVYGTDGKPMPNVKVRINHTGAHSFNPIELTTGTDGKASYYYTGKNAGIDTIVATVDNLSATATKEWYIKPLTHR